MIFGITDDEGEQAIAPSIVENMDCLMEKQGICVDFTVPVVQERSAICPDKLINLLITGK